MSDRRQDPDITSECDGGEKSVEKGKTRVVPEFRLQTTR